MPLFSIIIPTYNRSEHLSKVMRQLLSTQKGDYEIIIVDDGQDNTREMLESIGDDRIVYFHRDRKLGVSSARNFGVIKAKGEYIIFFDDDDEVSDSWISDFTEKAES